MPLTSEPQLWGRHAFWIQRTGFSFHLLLTQWRRSLCCFIALVVPLENGSSQGGESDLPPWPLLGPRSHRWAACPVPGRMRVCGGPPPPFLIPALDPLRVDPGSPWLWGWEKKEITGSPPLWHGIATLLEAF